LLISKDTDMENDRLHLLVIMVCVVAALCCTCTRKDLSLSKIKKAGYITFGVSCGYPPFCFYNNKNELSGYDIDVAKEIAKRLGVELKLIDTEWNNIFNGLNLGAYDGIVASMSITEERSSLVNFSIPYYHTKSVIVIRGDSKFKSRSDLSGKTIGVEEDTMFEKDAKLLPNVNIRKFKTSEQALVALNKNLLDAVITDEIVTNYVSGSKKYELETLGEPLRRDKVAIAFRKADHALLKKVNGVLKDMHDDGSLRKISSKMIKNNY